MTQTSLDLFMKRQEIVKKKVEKLKEQVKKRKDWKITPESVLEMYKNKEFSRDYALYMLETLIYQEPRYRYPKGLLESMKSRPYTDTLALHSRRDEFDVALEEAIKALDIYHQISPKTKQLLSFLEEIIIAGNWSKLRMKAMLIFSKLWPEKAKEILPYILENEEKLIYYFYCYWKIRGLRNISKYIKDPVIQLYFYNKWFFKKYKFRFNYHEKRIFGPTKTNSNIKLKIQNLDSYYDIFNRNGANILKSYTLDEIFKCEIKRVKTKSWSWIPGIPEQKVIKIFSLEKDYYAIQYRFFNKIIKDLMKLHDLTNDNFTCQFYKNYSVTFLYVEIYCLNLGIVFPTKKFNIKKECEC